MADMRNAIEGAGLNPKKRPGRGDRRGRGHNRPPKKDLPRFPDSYFGVDDQGRSYLRSDFVSRQTVDVWARFLGEETHLKTGQMRRFFNHCRDIERQLTVDGESWLRVSASFESLSVHAQNAVVAHKIPREFQDFINDNVKRVVTSEEPERAFLNGFLPHFEALVGFGAAYLKKDS